MNVSLYQAAATMNATTRWQEVITENLPAESIPGARRQEVSFAAVEAGLMPGRANGANRVVLPSTSVGTSFQQGLLRPTGVLTDLGIDGPGMLEVQLPNGTKAYTRDGEFHLNGQAQLVTKQGYAVMGDGGPVQLDPNDPSQIAISPSGELTEAGETKGRIRLVEFPQPGLLRAMGGGFFVSDSTTPPDPSPSSQLQQGFVEEGNSSPTTEIASLLTAMRMFEANQKVLQMQDDRMGRVISDLGNPS